MNNLMRLIFLSVLAVGLAEEACYSYGGGHVYPQETTRSSVGQNLVTSKAQISKPAPEWESTAVVKGEFKELKLKDFKGKYLVFFFYPLDLISTPRKLGGLGPINIPLLSDLTHQISKDYGVYLEDLGHTLRGLFIVDDKGVLRQITMNDLPVGRSVDETLRLVQAFQYTDKHGEVCPAGWKPGGDTIIPNPEDKLKYFSKFNQ
ncbi:peroxiredoxin-4-like isoform X2 [Stegodyphus dumicola]|uniref:peroxiredoxin-4-like isoform X2 n=1 Tax=Stegodyphus dumicola TaxID=202533 RepID=UPI0015ACFEEC|nr:peroxiredoxin-4-like isoform X2 [Stegodyphus dumicola]